MNSGAKSINYWTVEELKKFIKNTNVLSVLDYVETNKINGAKFFNLKKDDFPSDIAEEDIEIVLLWKKKLIRELNESEENKSPEINQIINNIPNLICQISENPFAWKVADVLKFLDLINFSKYKEKFKENSVDGNVLTEFNRNDINLIITDSKKADLFEKIVKKINNYIKSEDEKKSKMLKKNKSKDDDYDYNEEKNNRTKYLGPKKKIQEDESQNSIDEDKFSQEISDILIIKDEKSNKEYKINQVFSNIGRGKNSTIQINNDLISQNHLSILNTEGSSFIKDLNASNGSFIQIKDGCKIKVEKDLNIDIEDFTISIDKAVGLFKVTILLTNSYDEKSKPIRKEFTISEKSKVPCIIKGKKEIQFAKEGTDENDENVLIFILKDKKTNNIYFQFTNIKEKRFWIKLNENSWYPLYKGMVFRLADQSFIIKECGHKAIGKCSLSHAGKETIIADSIIVDCGHIGYCFQCSMTLTRECPKCGKHQTTNSERIYLDHLSYLNK